MPGSRSPALAARHSYTVSGSGPSGRAAGSVGRHVHDTPPPARARDAKSVQVGESWRRVVAQAATAGIPAPAFSSSLAYYDGLRRDRMRAALIQGLRDFFGAHTYRRTDRDGVFHTDWSAGRQEHPA